MSLNPFEYFREKIDDGIFALRTKPSGSIAVVLDETNIDQEIEEDDSYRFVSGQKAKYKNVCVAIRTPTSSDYDIELIGVTEGGSFVGPAKKVEIRGEAREEVFFENVVPTHYHLEITSTSGSTTIQNITIKEVA